jgi:hydrogenase expression/formation protein HypC
MCLAVPGKLLSVNGDDPLERTGRVSFGGVVKDVSLACVPEAKPGDYVLVHVGMALSVVDESEAQQVFEYLRQMEDLEELASPGPAPPQNPGSSDEIRG